ncbi:hypothetical protein GT030_00715 [Streptomyces sp. SID1328]|uniref:hypothetical protein n=1 Tax=Streptomyces sp. SID1328 TaxID=2690250 RepID=UPI00136C7CAA|nr:hypothetical protein [Streptomyces sp. SID1328]MYV37428.1 hypothetical protein [Streptomyces sp. SID1328]
MFDQNKAVSPRRSSSLSLAACVTRQGAQLLGDRGQMQAAADHVKAGCHAGQDVQQEGSGASCVLPDYGVFAVFNAAFDRANVRPFELIRFLRMVGIWLVCL